MIDHSRYEIVVKSGRKSGASRPIPTGELSIGTTLDSEFFIGCVDTWHQLLRLDASADLRSASASGDALPEQLMRVTLTNDVEGLRLRVEQGFVEIGQQRLLPGDSGEVSASSVIKIGASEVMIQPVRAAYNDNSFTSDQPFGRIDYTKPALLPNWIDSRVAMTVLTLVAVSVLSLGIVLKESPTKARLVKAHAVQSSTSVHTGNIEDDRIVAVISSTPAFLMTENGSRYELGAVLEDGFTISQISADLVEFTRGAEIQTHVY